MAQGPVTENTGSIKGVGDMGHPRCKATPIVRAKPNTVGGGPVQGSKGSVTYGGSRPN